MALVRQQGQLVETSGADTQKLAALQGVPVAPTTPDGVQGIGGNPDQAKMAGTPAQKGPVLADATKPADTLQTAQRTAAARTDNTDAEAQAAEKATKLQTLGSLSTRVEAMVANQLKLQNPVQAQVSGTQLDTLQATDADRATAQDLVSKIAANPTDPQALADATQFWVDKGWGTVDNFNPQSFLASAQQTLGQQAAAQVADQVQIKDLGLAPAEAQQLTEAFGDDSWQTLTPQQLGAKVNDLRQAEFNRIQGLKSQLATAQGAQRQQLLSELGDLGQAGVTGTEAQVKDLSHQVQDADTVHVGGEEYQVEDLLKDQNVSDLVTRMLGDPQLAAKVAESNPEFADWVKKNSQSLTDLAKTVGSTQAQVRDVNTQKQQLATVGNSTLATTVMQALVPDWGKVSATAPDVANNGVLQALKDPALDPAKQASMANALNSVAIKDPAMMKQLAGLSAADFQRAYDYGQKVDADNTGLLHDLTGVEAGTPFLTDPAQQAALAKYTPVVTALAAVQNQPGMTAALSDPATKPMLLDMIKDGTFTSDDAALLAKDPSRLGAYKQYHDFYTKVQSATNADQALDAMFGRDVDVNAINSEYQKAKSLAASDPTNTAARDALSQFKANLDFDHDGQISDGDLKGVKDRVFNADFHSILGGGSTENAIAKALSTSTLDKAGMLQPTAEGQAVTDALNSGKISSFTPDMFQKVMTSGAYSQWRNQNVPDMWHQAGLDKLAPMAGFKHDVNLASNLMVDVFKTGDSVGMHADELQSLIAKVASFNGTVAAANKLKGTPPPMTKEQYQAYTTKYKAAYTDYAKAVSSGKSASPATLASMAVYGPLAGYGYQWANNNTTTTSTNVAGRQISLPKLIVYDWTDNGKIKP